MMSLVAIVVGRYNGTAVRGADMCKSSPGVKHPA